MITAVPNIKAAEKWSLQSEKRAARNRRVRSQLKTLFKKAAASGETAAVEGAFDKAAAKGIIHPNKAARKKARLAKAVHRSTAAPAKAVKVRTARKKQP
jgi:small subunit ribosomal protein S20